MPELDNEMRVNDDRDEKYVELIACRGFRYGDGADGVDMKVGEKFTVPVYRVGKPGQYPMRFWIHHRYGARDEAEFEQFSAQTYAGGKGGPGYAQPKTTGKSKAASA